MSPKIRKVLLSPWLAIITLVLLGGVKLADPFMVEAVRLKFYDYLMIGKPVQSDQIVVANISEQTLEKFGQYPFSRDTYAALIKDYYDHGAGIVASSIMFPEPDRFGGDPALAQALAVYPTILSQTVGGCRRPNQGLKRTGVAVVGEGDPSQFLPSYPCVLDNVAVLQANAVGIGIASTLPEPDGVVRRAPLLAMSKGEFYPAFALEILRVAAGDPSYQAKINGAGVEAVRIPQFPTIKTDPFSRIFINWNYRFQQFDVGAPTPNLTGKIVIFGVTAAGIANPVPTPQGARFPQEVQANILQTLMNGDSIAIPSWMPVFDYASLIVLVGLIILASRLRFSIVYIAVLLAAYAYLPVYMFQNNHVLVDITFNFLAAMVIYIHLYTAKFISEYIEKEIIKKQFETYLAPEMVKRLQRNPNLLILGGETRRMTFMFSDIRGFTPISEQFKSDPQGLSALINDFLTPMTNTIMTQEGAVDKYMGDCIMAFWNAPLDVENHEEKAVLTAIIMSERLVVLNETLTARGLASINIGIGINSGDCVVGNMGSNQRFDYTVLGDAVNLASRLEGQSKSYGVTLVIGEETVRACATMQDNLIELDNIAVKGKSEPSKIYTYVTQSDEISRARHTSLLIQYQFGQWDLALKAATDLVADTQAPTFGGALQDYYKIMVERISELKLNPPADWDGIYIAKTK